MIITLTSCERSIQSFEFKYNDNGIDEINTFEKLFTREYTTGQKQIKFEFTKEEQEVINKYAARIDIGRLNIPEDDNYCDAEEESLFPALHHEFTFSINNGDLKKIDWGYNDCDNSEITKIQNFIDSVKQMIFRKDEFKDLKGTDILLL